MTDKPTQIIKKNLVCFKGAFMLHHIAQLNVQCLKPVVSDEMVEKRRLLLCVCSSIFVRGKIPFFLAIDKAL